MVTRLIVFVFILNIIAFYTSGQTLEFHSLQKLPATINTSGEEGMPLLSPDAKRLYFSRILYQGNEGGEYAGHDVWYTEVTQAGWKKADNDMSNINDKNNNVVVGIGKDGNTMYLMNASSTHKMHGIYFSKRINAYWTRPEFIPIAGIDNQDFIGMYVSPDFDVIFLSMKAIDSRGEEDIYFSVKNAAGEWSIPKNLGPTINTTGFEISPFLSQDKKRLYFSSNGHQGQGDADVFYSERLYNSWETWSVPVNIGPSLNSKKFDAYFSVYGDSVAYFASNRDGRLSDLYKAKVSIGRSVIPAGKKYFTEAEWNSEISKHVSGEIIFPNKISKLTASQNELIFYIANKLQLRRDIGFHLVVLEEESNALSKQRLEAIATQLIQSGIDASRIIKDQVGTTKASDRGLIKIQLFK